MTYELPLKWFDWEWNYDFTVFPKFVKSVSGFAVCHTITGVYGMYGRLR